MARQVHAIVTAALALALVLAGAAGCTRGDPQITERFVAGFETAELGPEWHDTGGRYRIADGMLHAKGAYNHPLWLRRRLPRDVAIELDVEAHGADGDVKVELFGDGESHAQHRGAYTATGYVAIFGGWKNSLSVLARMDEHGADRRYRPAPRVEPGKRYRFRIERRGRRVAWAIDGRPFLEYDDPQPLEGKGHEYFGFNNWESDVRFDNLVIEPLK